MDLRLSERAKIHWVLDTIVSHQIPVSIEFTESEHTTNCRLISVDSVVGYMTISQISSSETERRLTQIHPFSLSTNVNGVRIRLTQLSARPLGQKDGAGHFNVKIPPYVFYAQRRDVFRAQVNGIMDVSAGVYAANTFPSDDVAAMVQGQLANISVEGCAVLVHGSCSPEMQNYKLLTVLKFQFPDDVDFPFLFAKLCNCRLDSKQGNTMLGFSFEGNDKLTLRELGFLVTRIQLLAREITRLSA